MSSTATGKREMELIKSVTDRGREVQLFRYGSKYHVRWSSYGDTLATGDYETFEEADEVFEEDLQQTNRSN